MKRKKLVLIEWLDAATRDEWTGEDDMDITPPTCITVGHLVEERKDAIAVALSHDPENGNFSSWITIPKAMIKKRQTLIVKPRRKKR